MKNQKSLGLFLLAFLFFSLIPIQAQAVCNFGPLVPCGRPGAPTCQFCDIFKLLNNIMNYIIKCIAPIVAGLMLVIGGFYLLIAGTSPQLVSKAKSIITAAVIGLVIIFVAWIFLNTFLEKIGVATWTGLWDDPATAEEEGWWKINCP